MIKLISTILLFLICGALKSQVIHPITSMDSILDGDAKLIIVLTSQNCKWCEKSKHEISDNKLDKYVYDNYSFICLDVHHPDSIQIDEKVFQPSNDGYHQLVSALFNREKIATPTYLVLNESAEIVFDHEGYLGVVDLNKVLMSK